MIKYKPRLTAADMPENDNKYYIKKSDGGYSPCIGGYPQHKHLTVLSNCVGWAIGRAMEILQTKESPFPSRNAEDFYNSTTLEKGQTPKNGAIVCWRQGQLWNGGDGAGHVAVVEKVISENEIITSESAYGGMAFYTRKRTKGDGNWGMSAKFKLMGFIYLPEECVPDDVVPENNVPAKDKPNELKVGDIVDFKGGYHYASSGAVNPSGRKRSAGKAKITAIAPNAKHKYHLIGENGGSNVYGWVDEETIDGGIAPITVGCSVKLRQGATDYNGNRLASFVFNRTHVVKELKGDRAVITFGGAIVAAVNVRDLTVV